MSLDLNLDWEAQTTSQALVPSGISAEAKKELEIRFRRTLAVVQEQGVYAAILYLYGKEADGATAEKLLSLAQKVTQEELGTGARNALEFLSSATKDIHTMLLVKQLWEQTLIYARYACAAGA